MVYDTVVYCNWPVCLHPGSFVHIRVLPIDMYLLDLQFPAGDKFDHDVTDSVVNVIWAHGQVVDHYMPTIPPPAAGISKSSFISDFYRMRELKYHGLIGRGSTRKNFVNPASPGVSQCNYQVADGNIMYSATWGPSSSDASKIVFALEVTGEPSTWVGIGFSSW